MTSLSANQHGHDEESESWPPCMASIFDRIFEPLDATVVLVSGDGGTGKTLSMVQVAHYLATKLHRYVLTNILFVQKTATGWREVLNPHERVFVVKNMRDLWYQYALILKEDPFAIAVPILDEWHKYMKRLEWFEKIVLATLTWWGENRKYQTVPAMITQKMAGIPRQLLPYVRWYIAKSRHLTQAYNDAYGYEYSYRQLAFIIPIRNEDELQKRTEIDFTLDDVVQVIVVNRGPWTGDLNIAKVGEICYDSRSSAFFEMGEVRGTTDWFDDFMRHISSCPTMGLADRILEFFEEDTSGPSGLDRFSGAHIGMHLYKIHRTKMSPESVGHPIIKLSPHKGRKLVPIELNPTNLARLVDCSQSWLTRKMERIL